MFPSSGLFAAIKCPFSQRGLCERPHCLYKHVKQLPNSLRGSDTSSIGDVAGEQNGCQVNDKTNEGSLQELERINKEIESVKHEVEQEQRRLSHYHSILADDITAAPTLSGSKSETEAGPYRLSSGAHVVKTYSRATKYVVDNSKPRTDLEYDPLSNFSAGLRSNSSSGKEPKVKNGGLKRGRNVVPSRSPSPEPLDDSYEDCALIIDIPPSPDRKRARAQKPVAGKSLQEEVEVLEDVQEGLNTEPSKVTSPTASAIEQNRVYSNDQGQLQLYEDEQGENIAVDGSDTELTIALEDEQSPKIIHFQASETVVDKSPKEPNNPATTEQQLHICNNLMVKKEENTVEVESPHCELPCCVVKMNSLQPLNFSPKNSIFYKAPVANPATECAASVLPHGQEMSNKMSAQRLAKTAAPGSHLEPEDPPSESDHEQSPQDSSASNSHQAESVEQMTEDNTEVIVISSSSDEELHYSEIDLSDSDPEEECYRIFMEANEEKVTEEQRDVPVEAEDVAKPALDPEPHALTGRKRVAYDAKHTEQPAAKSRPQPQVLVPLREPAASAFASQPSIPNKIQQLQQRASMLTASVKGGQAFVSSVCQRKPEIQSAPLPANQTPHNLQSAPVQDAAYMNYIPLGSTVIGVDSNLRLILPEGTFPLPVSSSSSQVTSVLTPISHPSTTIYHPPTLTSVQRYRPTAPVLIPALARKPSVNSAFAMAHSTPAASTIPQTAVHTTVKPVPTKRKSKQQYEAAKDKVPRDIRQRYVNMFMEEFLKTTPNVNDAFEKALSEEKTVYNRSVNKLKYLSVAVNALKRLKNQNALAAKGVNEDKVQRSKGNISLNLKKFKGNDDVALYESLKDYILPEERLVENNYPVPHPEKHGCVVFFADNKKSSADPLKRICCRCGATYAVNRIGKHIRKEECNYHYGKGVTKRVPGGVETRYRCCEGVMGAPGCQVFQLHVHDTLSLDGFVSTIPKHPSDTSCPGVYSLDCEMCYTIHGLELSRVTVVNSSLQVIYDTFVRPDNEVIDYNTRFSGISEEDVKGSHTSLREVQETLLSFISAGTILIGHGLETALCALKLLHEMVVDTSVVFPHRLGPPHKLTLNYLTAEYLRRIIQESVCGHDTAEDAAACMELMLWKLKEDGKLKK